MQLAVRLSSAETMGLIIIFIFLIGMFLWLASVIRGLYDAPPSLHREAFALGYPRASMSAEPVVTPVETEPKWERLPQVNLDFASIVEPSPVVPATEVLPNFTVPPSKTEESLLFRSLVLGMFALSVISVDLAAGTHYSAVGIPFALLGNAWSWHRRHRARHWLNILVSVGSLAILFGGLVPILVAQMQVAIDRLTPTTKMSGTIELTLGMLLVSLQMGLSFHLYDRRSLGYCIVASGLLMAVAAGLSHDVSLLILLCGFMAIAMPTLMLDYRARLALHPMGIASLSPPGARSERALPWRYLSQLAALSLMIGMMLSVFLPNFHLPDLSGSTAQLNWLQNPAQKPPLPPPGLSPNSSPSAPSPPAPTVREMASKLLGQPGNSNYPDTIKQDNLQLPPELASQLQQATQQILATSPPSLNSDFDRAAYLADYLKQHYQEDPQLANRTDLSPIDPKSVQQFAAACTTAPQTCKLVGTKQDVPVVYTAMLRSIEIPARLKTDDNLSQIDPQTKLYPRPPAKSQSQTEVYFANWGWQSLDSTPDRPLFSSEPRQRERLQQQLQQLGGAENRPKATPTSPPTPSTPTSSPTPDSSRDKSAPQPIDPSPPAPAPSPATPPELPKWATDPAIVRTIVLILAIGGGIAWYWWYRRRQQQQLAHLPPVERIYRSMLSSLSKQSRSILPTQTQLEYAQNVGLTAHPQIAKAVWEISQQYTAWRYGKQSIDIRQLNTKLQYLQHLQQLAANRSRQQWFARQKSLWTPKNNLKPRT